MKKALSFIQMLALMGVLLFFGSCSKLSKDTLSNSLLIIQDLTGNDIEGNEVTFVQSDVLTCNNTVIADVAKATFTAKLLNPGAAESSQYNDILVTRYVVSYTRSDGNNIEGVDVPYSFEGYVSTLVPIGSVTEVDFIIVREVAKLEPPLVGLQDGRGDGVLEVKARIDFYGHDLANKTVTATGYLSIFFANYADTVEEEEEEEGNGGGNR